MEFFSRTGFIIDIVTGKIFPGTVTIKNGHIYSITPANLEECHLYILPGFIDAHVHIESSMLIPSEFARLASVHGTVATVSDPHEIANVLGMQGVQYMIENGKEVPFHFFFGAPSCVPATTFETAGAELSAEEISVLFENHNLHYLSEMMNYPGVIQDDAKVLEKLQVARRNNKPIDGHAPGIVGDDITKYIKAGITTDHECFTFEEGLEKISKGMHVLIREGSAAKNYGALHPLIPMHPSRIMFCCDDKHPDALVKGHINELVHISVNEHKYDMMDVLRIATLNPIRHYNLNVGLLQPGDSADFIIVKDLETFDVMETYVKGICIAKDGVTCIKSVQASTPNQFNTSFKEPKDFRIEAQKTTQIHIIHAEDGQLITQDRIDAPTISEGAYIADPKRDILKIAVVNRYRDSPPAVGFVGNFGLQRGAIASSVAHDSHNIVCVGCTDEDIAKAVNALIKCTGGIAIVDGPAEHVLPLPVAGIMSASDGFEVASAYAAMSLKAKDLGSTLQAPFMTLSFMTLLVIPTIKMSDRGLFDNRTFSFISLSAIEEKNV